MDAMQKLAKLERDLNQLKKQFATTIQVSSDNVTNPPTSAELNTAFGSVTTAKANGFMGVVDDSGAGTAVYLVTAVNGAWQAVRMGNNPTQLSVPFYARSDGTVTLTAQPSATQFLSNGNRNITRVDLTYYNQARLVTRVTTGSTSANNPRFILRYRAGAFSTTVGDYSDIGTAEVKTSLTTAGSIDSGWINLASGAKADVLLTVVQTGGDGAQSPVYAHTIAYFRRA